MPRETLDRLRTESTQRIHGTELHPQPVSRAAWLSGAAAFGIAVFAAKRGRAQDSAKYAVTHTDAEWHKILGPDRYAILRQNGTETPNSSPLLSEHRAGTYRCAGCSLPLFSSKTKYDSGDGWPSFYRPLPNAILTRADYDIGVPRTEVHCRQCGGHLGHVFDDGPPPTGLRYCIDGLALTFVPMG
ncbi:MAG TPA: peptide-methionine (R)-S-oxide reductase MsrB [Candidatus Baltobacteraceae bacterium]|nr:peptide-methionine (R)-S-oxide reductase MsrB [Candidatus Baltobacteraceae bacterium]